MANSIVLRLKKSFVLRWYMQKQAISPMKSPVLTMGSISSSIIYDRLRKKSRLATAMRMTRTVTM